MTETERLRAEVEQLRRTKAELEAQILAAKNKRLSEEYLERERRRAEKSELDFLPFPAGIPSKPRNNPILRTLGEPCSPEVQRQVDWNRENLDQEGSEHRR